MKVPIHNKEAEKYILGAIMVDNTLLPVVMSKLFPDAFYINSNKILFNAITALYDKGIKVNVIPVCDQLMKTKELDLVGQPYDIVRMTNDVVGTADIEREILIVLECYMKRQTHLIGHRLAVEGDNETVDPFDSINKASQDLLNITETALKGQEKNMSYYVTKVIEQRDRIKDTGQIGIDTGFEALNRVISGWCAPDLTIVAARPGMGKTALVISSINHLCVNGKIPCAFFSLEMSGEQIVNRLESIGSKIPHHILKQGKVESYQEEQLNKTQDKLIAAPLYIDDSASMNMRDLRAKAHILKKRHSVGAIFIDYLQLMSGTEEKGKSREAIISEISRGCKLLAKELELPVIALSQLSRTVESRNDKMPQLSDLRESGAIEQDADCVIFLMRPEYYNMQEPVSIGGVSYDVDGLVVCKIDKNRHGSTRNIALKFNGNLMKYSDYDQVPIYQEIKEEPKQLGGNWKPLSLIEDEPF